MTVLAPSPIGVETLDDPRADAQVVRTTLQDLVTVNRWCGGRRAVAVAFRELLDRHPATTEVRVLDVGAGAGDILAHLVRLGARRGVALRPVALDLHPAAARLSAEAGLPALVADAGRLPLAGDGVDVVVASQLLHHLDRDAAVRLLRELGRIARLGVIVADLRRSLAARIGVRLLAAALRFHPVTGHDGAVSVRRGFSAGELRQVLASAGLGAAVRRRPGFRLVAVWERARAHG